MIDKSDALDLERANELDRLINENKQMRDFLKKIVNAETVAFADIRAFLNKIEGTDQ